jgi:uncharacterized protein YciI
MRQLFFVLYILFAFNVAAQDYSVVFLHHKPDAEKISDDDRKKIMAGHMANMERLGTEGKLIIAGPFEGGGGIFVMKTPDVKIAREWIKDDPGIIANRWNIEIQPLFISQGKVCTPPAPYQMVNCAFVKFNVVVSKFNATDFPQIVKQHNDYLKQLGATGNVLLEAKFSDHDGGLIILKD